MGFGTPHPPAAFFQNALGTFSLERFFKTQEEKDTGAECSRELPSPIGRGYPEGVGEGLRSISILKNAT